MFWDEVTLKVTSADVPRLLRELEQMDVIIKNVSNVDDLSIILTISGRDYAEVRRKLEQRGDLIHQASRSGAVQTASGILKRPVLWIGIAVLVFLSLFLPTRILFVEVEGNVAVSEEMILQRAESCGICFGASRRKVRSEGIKNKLLTSIPELQWAGVNTAGCVATITVKEKSTDPMTETQKMSVCSIVAAQDGIITECIVRSGNQLCNVGQVVKAGQTLVSGYQDCGITVLATQADAEIMAETLRELKSVTPVKYIARGVQSGITTRFSLQIGKKLINFYKDSGISDVTCVKMYSKKYLSLPGGHALPVALITERCVEYRTLQTKSRDMSKYLEMASSKYLVQQMVSGQILRANTNWELLEDVYVLTGHYACKEMIGQIKYEENICTNGENGGKNR